MSLLWIRVLYRKYLFVHGSLNTKTKRPAFDLATAQTVVDQHNGELSLAERLRCRIRYFNDGVILGSQSFVESHFYNLQRKLGYRVVYQLFRIELRFDVPHINRQTRAPFSPATMRSHSGTGFRIFLFASVIVHCVCADLFAQNTSEVRRAFANIRSDDIPGNACVAFRWLDEHKEQLKDQLLTELYKTDRQGRDAILIVLYRTASFVPDQRFAQFLMFRLGEHDKYVALHALPGEAHIDAWDFIEKNFGLFEPLLVNQISPDGDLRTIWATAWLMKKKGIFSMNARLFTPAVLAKAAANLRNDQVEYNASWAARLFLLLGDQGMSALREGANSHDSQQKYLCRALIDAISAGSRRAFGYLSLRVDLWRVPNGTPVEYPEWLDDEMDYYFNRKRGPLELQPYP